MKKYGNITGQSFNSALNDTSHDPDGYPIYPESEDIYTRFKKEKNIDPEDITKSKEQVIVRKESDEDLSENFTADDLDIPGIVVDDREEVIGLEDEENSFYSLGGDDHTDLEENLGY